MQPGSPAVSCGVMEYIQLCFKQLVIRIELLCGNVWITTISAVEIAVSNMSLTLSNRNKLVNLNEVLGRAF